MNRIDRLLNQAITLHQKQKEQYDFSKLTTSELKEIICPDTSDERIMEILEPVRLY